MDNDPEHLAFVGTDFSPHGLLHYTFPDSIPEPSFTVAIWLQKFSCLV
jgi:hypothetical protein